MTDSQFASVTTMGMALLGAIVGAAAMWVWMTGPHECSAEIMDRYGHVAVRVTECWL